LSTKRPEAACYQDVFDAEVRRDGSGTGPRIEVFETAGDILALRRRDVRATETMSRDGIRQV